MYTATWLLVAAPQIVPTFIFSDDFCFSDLENKTWKLYELPNIYMLKINNYFMWVNSAIAEMSVIWTESNDVNTHNLKVHDSS